MATRDKCSIHAGWMNNTRRSHDCVVKDFANTRDPMMFAVASDTAVGRVVEFKAVIQNHNMFTFDVTSAYTHAWEDELVFLEPPPEETMFAAASDAAVGRVVEFKAVIQNYSMFTFDVTSAYTHAWEDELVFLEPPPGGDRGTW